MLVAAAAVADSAVLLSLKADNEPSSTGELFDFFDNLIFGFVYGGIGLTSLGPEATVEISLP